MKKILCLLILPLFFACEEETEDSSEVDPQELRKELRATEVEVGFAQIKDFEYLVNTSGKIEANREIILPFEKSAVIKKLNVVNAQVVRENQTLAELENEDEKMALRKAKMSYDQSYVNFQNDSLNYGSGQFTEVIKRNLELKNNIVSARLNIEEAELNLEKTFIKAPISGVVANLMTREGGMASGGNEFCRIYDPNSLVLDANILESDVSLVEIGQKVDVYPVSRNSGSFVGTVKEINPFVNENGLVTVRIAIANSSSLIPGMNANAVIHVPQTANVIVPKKAVTVRGGREVVFTIENGKAKWNYVESGLDNGVEIEILEGISAGAQVILTNNLQLAHDAEVAIVTPAAVQTEN
ncbi:efflux RND transporter periplasmic adaptor subunit [Fulvivirgaceae bacterium LMO-SS25]